MDANEINSIAEIVAKHVTNSIEFKISELCKDVDSHERILKGNNGDMGLIEKVRKNTDSVRKLYAGVGFLGGALMLEFISWLFPRLALILAP